MTTVWLDPRSSFRINPGSAVNPKSEVQLVLNPHSNKKEAPLFPVTPLKGAGDGLLSRVLSDGVPSALQVLTLVFGMGTGVAPAL